MTRNKEIKSSSTNLDVLENVDLQIKVFQKKLIYKVVILYLKNSLDNKCNSSLPAICNFTNAWISFQVFLVSASEYPN